MNSMSKHFPNIALKMQSIKAFNKCLLCFQSNNYLLIHKIQVNMTANTAHKRCLNSWLFDTQLKPFTSCGEYERYDSKVSPNGLAIRCLSTKESAKTDPKTPQTNPLTEESISDERKGSDVKIAGIVGIHQWDMKKRVRVKEWISVFHFPYIAHLRTVQRLKILLTIMCGVLIPVSYTLYAFDMRSLEACHVSTALGLSSLFMLYFFGIVFRRYVGRVYISDTESLVRLSHLSFFGNRIDTDVEIDDIVPLSDSNYNLKDWFCRIERYSTEDLLYMSLKYGGITNREGFDKVFGKNVSKTLN